MNQKAPDAELDRPALLELFCVFARIASITIGGGYVMFPLMKAEVVDSKGWATDEEMVDYYALGQSIPGIIAMNTATLVGYRTRGVPGAIAGALGMAVPSVIIIVLVAAFLSPYFDHPLVQKGFAGIRSAVVALILCAVWQVGKKSVNSWVKAAIAVASFGGIVFFGAHPVLMILLGGLLGLALFFRRGKKA